MIGRGSVNLISSKCLRTDLLQLELSCVVALNGFVVTLIKHLNEMFFIFQFQHLNRGLSGWTVPLLAVLRTQHEEDLASATKVHGVMRIRAKLVEGRPVQVSDAF